MRKGMYFKKAFIVSCAMFVPFCELMAQDETVYTAKYKFNYQSDNVALTPVGTQPVGTSFNYAGNYKRSSNSSWKDRVYLDKNNEGKITFTNFKYEVTDVKCSLMAEHSWNDDNVEATFTDYSDNVISCKNNIGFTFIINTFHNYSFLNERINGLKSMTMKQLNDNTVYYQGANDNKTPTFTISYYEPSVSFKEKRSSQIKIGETLDVPQLYTINHEGAFNFTRTYKSNDKNIFTVDKNGVITPKNLGKAQLTVTITDGVVKKTATKEIEVVAPNLGSNQYLITLKYNDGTDNSETVIATYGQDMPTVIPPTRKGYKFNGYWNNQTNGYGKQYYQVDGTSAAKWDKTWKETLYAQWTPRTYTVTFDLNDESHAAIFPDNVIANNSDRVIKITSDGKMNVKFVFDESKDNSIDLSVPKKPGYEMLGWYDDKDDLIVTIDSKNRHAYITDKNGYWKQDGGNMKWIYAGNLVLKAKYRCKYTVEEKSTGAIIKFGTKEKKEIVEPKSDWLSSVVSDLVGAAKEVGTKENPVMVFDLRNSTNVWNGDGSYECQLVMKDIQQSKYSEFISPNVLVYFNEKSYSAESCNNAILSNYTCPNLYVTDRYEIKVPYTFKAYKASYARDAKVADDDKGKIQAANSKWGTLCLPYPIRNNANKVKFYKLEGLKNNYMHFTPMDETVIPANTPVLYKRLEGVGSEINIEEASVDVPMNTSYSTNSGSSLDSWQFIGVLKKKVFCGKDYNNVPAGAKKMDGSEDIYYFKQDKFTHLSNKGSLIMYPYRAYFTTTPANAKFTTFSLIAIDEEGATDITNLIDNDAEGDGKIYDLNGRRVMQPVSGRLYIVNGKKKVY